MSATSGHGITISGSYVLARQRRLQTTLDRYGVLTRSGLCDLAGADNWRVPYDTALRRAVQSGRVRQIGPDLYEAGDERA
jgi:hypothetical protein